VAVHPLTLRSRQLLARLRKPKALLPAPPSATAGATVVVLDQATTDAYLYQSIEALQVEQPDYCADRTVTREQRLVLLVALAVTVLGVAFVTRWTLMVLIGISTYLYNGILVYRVLLFRRSLNARVLFSVSDEDARAVPTEQLPIYTVLIPAYREPEVIARLIADVLALEYPRSRLDVKLLIEQDDPETLSAIHACAPPPHVTVVLIPPVGPRTKPKAVNFGLCLAKGSIVTIFDAEDRPEPLQLRRAAVAFSRAEPQVVCLQASLAYYNADQNIITRWFEGEYLSWFRFFLPGLAAAGAPIPLGGTSNHIRREALELAGGWDPFNVTEDADLGLRLHRMGFRCGVLDSVTEEEATSDFVNWIRQRSRWHKGYLQTWLVHMRHPRLLRRELGWSGFINVNLFVGGTPLLALLNPVFWTLTVLWFLTTSAHITALFPPVIYYPALVCWVLGNTAVAYLNILSVQLSRQPRLALAALISPLYWVMMSGAAFKAIWQLFRRPSLWEKTTHGMHHDPVVEPEPVSVGV
jgi:cellulose synthase/poly-beta-1,6-N-acetylglucosamine synthase-like glycosyltransferase